MSLSCGEEKTEYLDVIIIVTAVTVLSRKDRVVDCNLDVARSTNQALVKRPSGSSGSPGSRISRILFLRHYDKTEQRGVEVRMYEQRSSVLNWKLMMKICL